MTPSHPVHHSIPARTRRQTLHTRPKTQTCNLAMPLTHTQKSTCRTCRTASMFRPLDSHLSTPLYSLAKPHASLPHTRQQCHTYQPTAQEQISNRPTSSHLANSAPRIRPAPTDKHTRPWIPPTRHDTTLALIRTAHYNTYPTTTATATSPLLSSPAFPHLHTLHLASQDLRLQHPWQIRRSAGILWSGSP